MVERLGGGEWRSKETRQRGRQGKMGGGGGREEGGRGRKGKRWVER